MYILESNVRVQNKERAEDSIRDGVEGSGSERSNSERDQANSDQSVAILEFEIPAATCYVFDAPLESPMVATVRGVGFRDGGWVVHCVKS